jgi:DNA invertase Pin-like site-specific DNA recombinase
MMREVKADRVGVIIVRRLDRLHRNLKDFLDTLAEVDAHDVALHSITEHVDTKSASGRLLVNILMSFHAFQSEKLREDVIAGMHQKIREGGWANRAPMGYLMEDGALVVDEKTAEAVREGFRMAAKGASLREIAEPLAKQISTVAYILTNPIYAGFTYEHQDRLPSHPRTYERLAASEGVYRGDHEPLIAEREWDMVQFERSRVSPAIFAQRHLLAGLLRCECGAATTVVTSSPPTKLYRCCRRPHCYSISMRRLELTMLNYLNEVQSSPEMAEQIRTALQEQVAEAKRTVDEQLDKARKEYERASREENRWRKLYVEEKITEGEYLRGAPALVHTREHWEGRVDVLEGIPVAAQNDLDIFEAQALLLRSSFNVQSLWDGMTEPEKAVLVREFVEYMVMGRTHLTVKINGFPEVDIPYVETRGRPRKIPPTGSLPDNIGGSVFRPERCVVRTTTHKLVA